MASEETWVFGYGSLIWRPGFEYAERRRGVLGGYRRSFCMTSVHYRGTPEQPGLVLALDHAASSRCDGVAYLLAPETRDAAIDYLRARELVSNAYDEVAVSLELEDGRAVQALTYVVNRAHAQYRGGLSLEEQCAVIARAVGPMGPNAEYLMNTVAALATLGLNDPELDNLADMVRARIAAEHSGA